MFFINKRSTLLVSMVAMIAVSISGCVTTGAKTSASAPVEETFSSFARGEVRLTCVLPCSFADGFSRSKYKALYQNEQWRDLALEVIGNGFQQDRNYYYLGRSAEGLGFKETARIYYKLALATSSVNTCAASPNVCDGVAMPSDVFARQNFLDRQAANELAARRAAEQAVADKKAADIAAQQAAANAAQRRVPVPLAPPKSTKGQSANESALADPAKSDVAPPKKPPTDGNVRSLTDL